MSQSFFDFYSVPATALWGAYPASDTGDPGWMVMGYTAQFGNGLSASIAAEERRLTQIININGSIPGAATGTIVPGGFTTTVAGRDRQCGAYGGFQSPDVVANLRVDQTWGSAQLMAALHEVNANYYGSGAVPGCRPSQRQVGLRRRRWRSSSSYRRLGRVTTSRPRSTTPKVPCVTSS